VGNIPCFDLFPNNVMRPRNLAILSIVLFMSFGVARMLMTVSRAEQLGPETARVSSTQVIATDVAGAPTHSGEGGLDHFVLAASTHVESLLLLLLGSILLAVASGIKMAQSRRVR
jgi:hypothetical protein